MTATAVRTAADPQSVPAKVRASIESERRAVTEEVEAFSTFLDRIEEVPAESPTPAGSVREINHRPDGSGLGRVRDAYEATVMSVSHYDEDYGDTYRESVIAEFGPEIGVALTERPRFQPYLKRATIGKARSCRDDRESFLETLEVESRSATAVGGELRGVQQELREFESGSGSTAGYGTLEAEWRRLDTLAETLDRLATTRQQAIIRQRREFTAPSSAPDIPTYLYTDSGADYPLLAFCVRLRKRVRQYKSERERKLAGV